MRFVRRHPQHIREAAIAAYGKRSMNLLAADLGVTTSAISHWWAQAKRDGIIEPLFGRFNGASVKEGRVRLDTAGGQRIDPNVSRDARRAAARLAAEGGRG